MPRYFLSGSQYLCIPSECQMIVEAFREAGVVEDEQGC